MAVRGLGAAGVASMLAESTSNRWSSHTINFSTPSYVVAHLHPFSPCCRMRSRKSSRKVSQKRPTVGLDRSSVNNTKHLGKKNSELPSASPNETTDDSELVAFNGSAELYAGPNVTEQSNMEETAAIQSLAKNDIKLPNALPNETTDDPELIAFNGSAEPFVGANVTEQSNMEERAGTQSLKTKDPDNQDRHLGVHVEDLMTMIKDAEKNILLLNKARISSLEELNQACAEKDALQGEINLLQMRLAETDARLKQATQEKIKNELLEGELESLKREITERESIWKETEDLKKNNMGIQDHTVALKSYVSSSPSAHEQDVVKAENQSLNEELNHLKSKLTDISMNYQYVEELEKEMLSFKLVNKQLESKLAIAEANASELANVKAECQVLRRKVEDLQTELEKSAERRLLPDDIVITRQALEEKISRLEEALDQSEVDKNLLQQTLEENLLLHEQVKILEQRLFESDTEIRSQLIVYQQEVQAFQKSLEQLKKERRRQSLDEPVQDLPWDFWSNLLLSLDGWMLEKKMTIDDAKILRDMAWRRNSRLRDAYSQCYNKNENDMIASLLKLTKTSTRPGLHVVHIAAEMAPVAKVGGLGDVVTGLGKALQKKGHLVEIILPKYDCMDYSRIGKLKVLDVQIDSYFDGRLFKNKVWLGTVEGLPVYFIEPHHPAKFFWRGQFYGEGDDFRRFTFFSRAALEFILQSGKKPDVIHCHDWQTAFVAPLYWDIYTPQGLNSARIAFTCHNFEYQAWYDVSLKLNGSQLKVHFVEFQEEEDETLALEDFQSVQDLRARFRFSSKQLQDENCGKVKEGMHICASCSSDGHDIRFFDAVVQKVCRSKHRLVNEEEECRCTFKVLWKAGPFAYKSTSISCQDICLLTPGSIESHPVIKAFVKLIEEEVDCNVRSLGRKPLKKNVANMKGSNTTNCKDKQGEPGKTSSNAVSASYLKGNCIISGRERVENILDTFKQNDIDQPKNRIEAVLPSVDEVADSTLHVPSVSSQSCQMEKKTNDGLNASENVVTVSEVLIRNPVSGSNKLEIPDISGYHMDSQINISSSSHHENVIKMQKTTDEAPLGTTIKITDEAPLGTTIKITDEAPHDDTFVIICEKTHFDSLRKEEKLSLDLNSMPVELEQDQFDIPTPAVSFYSNANIDANITNRKDNRFLGLDNNVGIPENLKDSGSGWIEAEDCDILKIEKSRFNVVNNDIASNSACLTADIKIKGSKLSEDHSLSIHRGMKRASIRLLMDNRDEDFNSERVGEQLTGEEYQKDAKTMDDKDGETKFLACSWGKGKRKKHRSNEMFSGERKVQDYNQTGENVKASKKLRQDGNDFNGVDTLSSSCLTSHLKHNTNHNTMEPLDFSIDTEGLVDQNLANEETKKLVHDCEQSVEQIISDQVPPREIPIEVVEMSSDNKSRVLHLQSNASYDINAQRSSCLSASPIEVNIRNVPSDSFKDSSDHPDQPKNKVDTVKDVTKNAKLNRKDKSSPGFLPHEENDHGTSRKKYDNEILDLSRRLGNHVQLQKGLSPAKKIKEDCTCKTGCHKNGQTRNEYNPIYTCKHEGQKNVPAILHPDNGYSVSEKSNCCSSDYSDAIDMPSFHNELYFERCRSHLTSKECEKMSQTSCKVCSRPSELHLRQTSLTTYNQHKIFSGNSIAVHYEHSSLSSECKCCKLHSCDSSASSEDESFDGEVSGCIKVSDRKYCVKSMKPTVSSKRASLRICRGPQEARCGCNGAGFGHCSEDMRIEERKIHYSGVLVLDNLEKDVTPSAVKEVISSVTRSVVKFYIFPSSKFEQFTRGFVWFQDHASLMKALVCLQDDSFFIVSSNGRPWVVHIDNGVCEGIVGGYTIDSKDSKQHCSKTSPSSKILFVRKGTHEYERAKIRKNAFLEFRDHLAILHKRLELEEK